MFQIGDVVVLTAEALERYQDSRVRQSMATRWVYLGKQGAIARIKPQGGFKSSYINEANLMKVREG